MNDFRIIFYLIIVMYFLFVLVFSWGWFYFRRIKTGKRFFNKPIVTLTTCLGAIGLVVTFLPIFFKIWNYSSEDVKSDSLFISFLAIEIIFLLTFLVLTYLFVYDFGVIIDETDDKLSFFGQTVKLSKVVDIEKKKFTVKIVYQQGFKNLKKKLPIFTPNAKKFIEENLPAIVERNLAAVPVSQQLANAEKSVLGKEIQPETTTNNDKLVVESTNINNTNNLDLKNDSNLASKAITSQNEPVTKTTTRKKVVKDPDQKPKISTGTPKTKKVKEVSSKKIATKKTK